MLGHLKKKKSIPIKVWPRQQKNKRKKKTIKIKETRKFEKQNKNLQILSLTFLFQNILSLTFRFDENFLSLTFSTHPSYFVGHFVGHFS